MDDSSDGAVNLAVDFGSQHFMNESTKLVTVESEVYCVLWLEGLQLMCKLAIVITYCNILITQSL